MIKEQKCENSNSGCWRELHVGAISWRTVAYMPAPLPLCSISGWWPGFPHMIRALGFLILVSEQEQWSFLHFILWATRINECHESVSEIPRCWYRYFFNFAQSQSARYSLLSVFIQCNAKHFISLWEGKLIKWSLPIKQKLLLSFLNVDFFSLPRALSPQREFPCCIRRKSQAYLNLGKNYTEAKLYSCM